MLLQINNQIKNQTKQNKKKKKGSLEHYASSHVLKSLQESEQSNSSPVFISDERAPKKEPKMNFLLVQLTHNPIAMMRYSAHYPNIPDYHEFQSLKKKNK